MTHYQATSLSHKETVDPPLRWSDASRGDVTQRNIPLDRIRNMSSVDYMACCGAGHRMTKLSDASYVSKKLGFALRSFWGYCDTTEVYTYLFGPQPANELDQVESFDQYARINNDVPGFNKIYRQGNTKECPCVSDKLKHDAHFYSSHRNRFRAKTKVDKFRNEHFLRNTTIIGMHIRAGNGEKGDFAHRGRSIDNVGEWVQNLAKLLLEQKEWGTVQKLFLATDTPSIVPHLKELFGSHIQLIHLNQIRPEEGSGVLFGERGKVLNKGIACKRGWMATIMDMILLSHADVVIAARPSSFTQSMPMSLVLSTPKESRKVSKPFCEVNPTATEMNCFVDVSVLYLRLLSSVVFDGNNMIQPVLTTFVLSIQLVDWCCRGMSNFSLSGIKQKYEYLRMPESNKIDSDKYKILSRPDGGCVPRPEGWKQPCLPYDFSEFQVISRRPSRRKMGN